MEDNNENLSQISPALPSSEKQGPKPKDTLKIATIVCAVLAVTGISFGIYEAVQNSAKDKRIFELEQLIKEDRTGTNSSDSGGTTAENSTTSDNRSTETETGTKTEVEAIAEKPTNDMRDGDSISIADAQTLLNEKLQLPLHSFVFISGDSLNYSNNLLKNESGRATLIQSIAGKQGLAQQTKSEACQEGAYITTETYRDIYKKVFGLSFEYRENTKYGQLGQFKNKPCTCDCSDEAAVENGYYVWNNTYIPYPEVSFTVEKVEGDSISGRLTSGDNGETRPDFEVKGRFVIEYGHNESGYYIVDMSLSE